MKITAGNMHFKQLNDLVRNTEDREIEIENCIGQRYIASGLSGKEITIHGVPGNALGAYLDGSKIIVKGNTQEATGDTMNDGMIAIYGNAGDATGYAMRGGKIYIEGSSGYRTGIHMKQYEDKVPVIIIGGSAGSFLGEYQAGGLLVVLGMDHPGKLPVSNFCGTGMHGGHMYIRSDEAPKGLPVQVSCEVADDGDKADIREYVAKVMQDRDKYYLLYKDRIK